MTDKPTIVDRVAVRMYRNILGDCFLLTITGRAGADQAEVKSHIMIDCGVLQGTPNAGETMRAVVADVYAHTQNKPLDLIVVTHEHHDHISGFGFAREVFKPDDAARKAAEKVWFAWTEDSLPRAYGPMARAARRC